MRTALLPVLAAASVLAGEPLVVETIRLEHESAARVAADLGKWLAPGFCEVVADERDPDGKRLLFHGRQGDLPAVREIVAGLDVVHPEIRIDALVLQIGSPTNRESAMDWYYRALLGADPALFPESDRPAVACYRGTLDAARAAAVSDGNALLLGMPRVVFRDRCKAEVSLLDIDGEPGKPAVTNGVRLSVRPLVCRGGTPLLRLTAEASVFAGDDTAETEELGLALEPGAAAVFAPPPAGDCRVLVLLFPDDAWSRAADPATNAPAVPLDLSVRFVELTDAALSNDFFRAAFAGTDSNSSEPVSDDVATFTQIFTAPQADLLLLRLTNEFGCRATFRQTQRWNGGDEAQFSFRTSVFRYRNGQESPVEERTSGFFLSVAPRLESPSPGCWSISFELGLTDVGRPSPETPAGADGVYPERPFVPVRKLATSVDVFPGSVVFFRAGDGTTRSPLVILECTPAAPLPAAPAVPPPASPAVPDGFARRLYSAPWMEHSAAVFPYLVPTNATAPSGEAVLALARELGADIPEGSTARYMPEIGKLSVATSPAAQAEIEQLLSLLWGAAGGRVEVAASLLAVAAGDLDAFLARFGVPASPAALLAPVLARQPSLDDLLDLAESPPAAPFAAPSHGEGRPWFGGVARRTVANDATAELRDFVEYIFPEQTGWGVVDVPAPAGGAVSDRAIAARDPFDFRTRPVGPEFRIVPRLRTDDDRIHLSVRFEHTGDPVWARIPSAGVPLRHADGSFAMVSGIVRDDPPRFYGWETPEFPSFAEECALDLADGEAALLRPFPDPNAPADAPRFFVPVVSARRIADPVQESRRTPH